MHWPFTQGNHDLSVRSEKINFLISSFEDSLTCNKKKESVHFQAAPTSTSCPFEEAIFLYEKSQFNPRLFADINIRVT